MNLEELRALVAVVETGSFVAAAKSLNIPRASLRRRVDELEARAGTALLIRTPSGVSPTPAGETLVRSGRLLLQQANAILAQARQTGLEPAGVMRVLLPHGIPVDPLLLLLRSIEQYRSLSVDLRYSSDPLSESLDDVDFVLHFGTRIPDGPWLSYELVSIHERLLATDDWLESVGCPVSLNDLQGLPLFMWRAPGESSLHLPLVGGGEWPVQPRVTSSDGHAVRVLATSFPGLAFAPDSGFPLPGDVTSVLRPVLPDIVGRRSAFRLLVPAPLIELPKIKIALQLIRAFLGDLQQMKRNE